MLVKVATGQRQNEIPIVTCGIIPAAALLLILINFNPNKSE